VKISKQFLLKLYRQEAIFGKTEETINQAGFILKNKKYPEFQRGQTATEKIAHGMSRRAGSRKRFS